MSAQLNCESCEILISAMLDDELNSAEYADLNSHLEGCVACRSQVDEFVKVNSAVELTGQQRLSGNVENAVSATKLPAKFPNEEFVLARNQHLEAVSIWSPWRLIPMGVAAALLVCFTIAVWPNPQPASANSFSAEEFVGPMIELEALQIQKQNDQELMLKTLSMDLRSMRLEVNQLEPGSAEREILASQIDAMMERVKAFQKTSNTELQAD